MSTRADSTTSGARTAPRWPRVHLVYFLLAAFDLVAVAGGLYLSHRLSEVFVQNVATNQEWGRRFQSVWDLGDIGAKVNAPGNDVFESRDPAREARQLDIALSRFNAALASVRAEIMREVPASVAALPLGAFSQVSTGMAEMAGEARRVLAQYKQGDIIAASASMARMDRKYVQFRQKLNDASRMMLGIQDRFAERNHATVERLKSYEYFIGAGIIMMVCCIAMYGHWIGGLMRRKYAELARSNDELYESRAESMAFATQLQAINDDVTKLNVELAENMRRLKDAQDDAVRKGKLAQLGQLTATIAHELRNPLGAVRTSAFLIERKLKDKGTGVETQLQRIATGITRCDNIIGQLLDFARTRGLQCEARDLDAWIARLIEDEAQKLPAAVEVECVLGLDGMQVPFDADRMSRVFINLISNASEAMVGKGDDPSKFAVAAPKICITTRLAGGRAEVTVADNGPGISADVLPKILEPMFTTKNFGTGLGLPAVERILEQHGGGLSIDSEPGKGARFTAWMPLAAAVREAA